MDGDEVYARLAAAAPRVGMPAACLRLGNRHIRIDGLDARDHALLGARWGAFLEPERPDAPAARVEIVPADRPGWLVLERAAEAYRLTALGRPERPVVVSYNFALARLEGRAVWRAAIHHGAEPPGRVLDNVLRYVVARTAVELGGLALHGAGVLRGRRAWIFAGPSGSGKSTAVGLSAPAPSLGDDFAMLVPGAATWLAPALPFDNAERIAHDPPRGMFPVAGVWRLVKAERHHVERPAPAAAVASLLGCAAFPWAMPELGERMLVQATRIVEAGRFAHLHFLPDRGFWSALEAPGAST